MKKIKCDVVVVGAGPGGSMAAKTCAKHGLDTVLVERKEKPGKPNSFGCLVSRRISEYININKKTVSTSVNRMVQTAPDGTEISTLEPNGYDLGYVLNRETFDDEVLKIALKENLEYMNRTRATGLIKEGGKIRGIKAKINEKEDVEVRSKIIIGADGVEHHIGKWAGIYERLDPAAGWVVIDNLLDHSDIDEHSYYQIIGWKDDDKVMRFPNVLYVLYPKDDGKTALQLLPYHSVNWQKKETNNALNYCMNNHPLLKKSNIIKKGGGVLSISPLKKYTTDNVILVGESAHANMMPWGTGALTAMESGIFAGERAVEACEEGNFSSEFLSKYEKRWHRSYGEKKTIGFYSLRFMMPFPDEYWDRAFHLLKENNNEFTDEFFHNIFKSPKFIAKVFSELNEEGWETPDIYSFLSLWKKYYQNYWDTFVE